MPCYRQLSVEWGSFGVQLRVMPRLTTGVLILVLTMAVSAQEGLESTATAIPHAKYRVLVAMAECKSLTCLTEQRNRLQNDDALANLVFFNKEMVIHPTRASAAGVLQTVPTDEAAQITLANFASWQDGNSESDHDMDVLGQIYFDWPKVVGKAALMRPDMMSHYVKYLRLAANDIHSDFTGNAERVCRSQRVAFNNAFRTLPEDDQRLIRKTVFDPSSCKAIFRSEAD